MDVDVLAADAPAPPPNDLPLCLGDTPGVSSDTTSRTTTRPNVDEELDERLSRTTTPLVRVPADRLTFADRLRVLLDEYDERTDERDTLREQNERLRERVDELETRLDELQSSGLMS